MATKSDFAQKLLTDLRQRKERMAAAQNSSRTSSQTSRVTRGNTGQTSRGARQINALESTSSVTGKPGRRSTGATATAAASRSANNIKESSNQIVLYDGSGQNSRQVRDLQMAIAFAFENSGNLTTTNPLVNFFNRFGRKSQKMETTTFYNHRSPGQTPTVSHIHINEISKGVHKLNQILTACSNLDRNSIEIGRELLKGAVNLEESLRMLVTMQDASGYYGDQKKSRLKLVDVDEEDEKNYEREVEQWKLDRPRFSFDHRNSSLVQGTARARQNQLALTYRHESNSDQTKNSKSKGRISNVVAKLMGLEEIPQNVLPKPAAIVMKKQQNHTQHEEDKHSKMERASARVDQKQKQKQNPVERMINPPKPKRSTDVNIQKLSVKSNPKAPPSRKSQESRPPIQKKATLQKRGVGRGFQRKEIPEKLEAVMSRRKVAVERPANVLKDLKQQMQIKNRVEKRGESRAKEEKKKLESKDEEMIVSNSAVAAEFQNQNFKDMREEQHSAVKGEEEEEEVKKLDQSIEIQEEITEPDLPQQEYMQLPALNRQEQLQLQLTEPEKNLKETVIKSQLFLSTAEALFKLNIPLSFLHAGSEHHEHHVADKKLLLDTAYEVVKRKARRQKLMHQPTLITRNTMLRTLDDLVRQLCKDMEMLKSYGGDDGGDVAAGLHKMLERDIYSEEPDVNCMWDLEWSRIVSEFGEMEDVVRDVERQMMNGLLDEIAKELVVV